MKHASALLAGLALMACAPPDKPPEANAPGASPSVALPPPPTVASSAPPATASTDLPTPPSNPSTDDDKCGKSKYAALIGKPETDPGVPASSPSVRHIRPGMQVTMDYRPDRLNIYIGPDGIITQLKCT